MLGLSTQPTSVKSFVGYAWHAFFNACRFIKTLERYALRTLQHV
jgi:hypothetical protein